MAPYKEIRIMVLDPSTDSISFMTGVATGSDKFASFQLATSGKLYSFANVGFSTVLEVNPSTNTFTMVGSSPAKGTMLGGLSTAANGYIYSIPSAAGCRIFKFNPSDYSFTQVGDPTGLPSYC